MRAIRNVHGYLRCMPSILWGGGVKGQLETQNLPEEV